MVLTVAVSHEALRVGCESTVSVIICTPVATSRIGPGLASNCLLICARCGLSTCLHLPTYGQFPSTTPTRLNSTQLNCSAKLANNAWSVHSCMSTRVFNSGRLSVNTPKNFSPYAQILRHDVQINLPLIMFICPS